MLNTKSQTHKSETPIATSGKNKMKILIALIAIMISAISVNVKAQPEEGCPWIVVEGPCTPQFNMMFPNSTYNRTICTGDEIQFYVGYAPACSLWLSTNVSAGYPPCASSFPGVSAPVLATSIVSQTWSCIFSVPGNYQYVFCLALGDNCHLNCEGCITLNIEVVDELPFTIAGPQNNCLDADGWSMYTLVPPTTYTGPITSFNWTLTGMTLSNPSGISLTGSPFGASANVDFNGATFDNNGTEALLCVDFQTCCGPQQICYPIYQCCTSLHAATTVYITDGMASQLYNDPAIAPYLTLASGVYTLATSADIYINGTFTIDQPFTFEDCPKIKMGPEAKIVISPSSILTFSSPQVFHTTYNPIGNPSGTGQATVVTAGCNIMWDGIYFEDAFSQLFINPGGITNYTTVRDARNAVVNDFGAFFEIKYAQLENNNKDIVVNTFTGQGAHPGIIEQSVLTTNTAFSMLPYYTPNTININPALPRTNIGIEINTVDDITIGPLGVPANHNTFSYMDIGIVSNNSYLRSRNNWFDNINRITACPNPLTSPCTPEGVGIYSKSTILAPGVPALEVGGSSSDANNFNDVDDGVYAEGPQDASVGYNVFTNVKRGIYATRSMMRNTAIFNNTIDQFSTGIWTVNNPSCYIEINDNVLNGTYATIQQGTGIKVEEPQQNAQFSSIVKIHDNWVNRIRTGIHATNLVSAEINNYNNIMFETLHPNTWNASYGIRVQNNSRSYIQDNTVYRCSNSFQFGNPTANCPPGATAASTYTYTATNTSTLIGISMERNSFCDIFNNSTAYLGAGIRDFATSTANTYNCNTMAFCQWMLWLDNTNPGPGQQGTSTTSQGNQWRSSAFPNLLADVQGTGTTPVNQGPWYVSSFTLPDAPQAMSPPLVLDLQPSSNTNPLACSYPAIIADSPEERQYQLATLLEWTRELNCPLTETGKFIARVEIYKELIYDNSLMNLSTSYDAYLQDFYDDEAETNIGIMAQVRYNIDSGEYEEAESANSTINPDNSAADNEATTNQIYLDTWAKEIYTYTQTQYNLLSDIAEQNPITGGPAVYTARVMLEVDYDDFGNIEERLSTEKQLSESLMHIYPNPANDELNVAYSLGKNETAIFTISDLLGKEVFGQSISPAQNLVSISTKSLEQGIYFAQIKVNDEIIIAEKLLIAR